MKDRILNDVNNPKPRDGMVCISCEKPMSYLAIGNASVGGVFIGDLLIGYKCNNAGCHRLGLLSQAWIDPAEPKV